MCVSLKQENTKPCAFLVNQWNEKKTHKTQRLKKGVEFSFCSFFACEQQGLFLRISKDVTKNNLMQH